MMKSIEPYGVVWLIHLSWQMTCALQIVGSLPRPGEGRLIGHPTKRIQNFISLIPWFGHLFGIFKPACIDDLWLNFGRLAIVSTCSCISLLAFVSTKRCTCTPLWFQWEFQKNVSHIDFSMMILQSCHISNAVLIIPTWNIYSLRTTNAGKITIVEVISLFFDQTCNTKPLPHACRTG